MRLSFGMDRFSMTLPVVLNRRYGFDIDYRDEWRLPMPPGCVLFFCLFLTQYCAIFIRVRFQGVAILEQAYRTTRERISAWPLARLSLMPQAAEELSS